MTCLNSDRLRGIAAAIIKSVSISRIFYGYYMYLQEKMLCIWPLSLRIRPLWSFSSTKVRTTTRGAVATSSVRTTRKTRGLTISTMSGLMFVSSPIMKGLYLFEPPRDKTNNMLVLSCRGSDEFIGYNTDCSRQNQQNDVRPAKIDQTGWMPRLIWVFAGLTLILLVLSWGGSFAFQLHTIMQFSPCYVPPPKGRGTYCFWCGPRWRPRCSLSALYLLNQ